MSLTIGNKTTAYVIAEREVLLYKCKLVFNLYPLKIEIKIKKLPGTNIHIYFQVMLRITLVSNEIYEGKL